MFLCSYLGAIQIPSFCSTALSMVLLVVNYLCSEATHVYLSSQNILLTVGTKKFSENIQFLSHVLNLLNSKKKKKKESNYLKSVT